MPNDQHIYIHFPVDLSPIETRFDQLMTQIDDLQTQFDTLNTTVRDFLANVGAATAALQDEINTLKADDAVEDSKLAGLTAAAAELTGVVQAFHPDVPPAA
jgi:prefoldin subunit 5